MSGRHVLVTGGAGYLGSTLTAELLAGGDRVRVVDSLAVGGGGSVLSYWGRHGFEFHAGDVRDDGVRRSMLTGVDAVVHLAAVVGDPACARDPETARRVNLDATRALLEDCAASDVRRFLFASTCSSYGKMLDVDAVATEDWELRPVSLYAETKVEAETAVLAATSSELATSCLRFATLYGASARMRFDLTVNEFARDALVNGELVVYGEQFWRPYVHVGDAARAIVAALDAAPEMVAAEVFNVGDTAQNLRKQDLVELIVARLPDTKVERVARTEDPRDYRVSFDKIRATLGFGSRRTVSDGIDEVIGLLRAGVVSDPFAAAFRN
jgi:nucleoside-diphosphate-sugar epimerase